MDAPGNRTDAEVNRGFNN